MVPQAWGGVSPLKKRACNTLCSKAMPHNVLLPQLLPHFYKGGDRRPGPGNRVALGGEGTFLVMALQKVRYGHRYRGCSTTGMVSILVAAMSDGNVTFDGLAKYSVRPSVQGLFYHGNGIDLG